MIMLFLCRDSRVAIRDADYWLCRVSGVETLIVVGVGSRDSGRWLLISCAVAAGVIAAPPESLSLFGTFLDHTLEHRFATFRAEWRIGR